MDKPIELSTDDVLDLEGAPNFGASSTCKVNELISAVRRKFTGNQGYVMTEFNYFVDGVTCRFLPGDGSSGWQTGVIRFRLEFIPDIPDYEEGNEANVVNDASFGYPDFG